MNITCNGKIIQLVKVSDRKLIAEPTHCPKCGTVTTRNIRGVAGAVTYCTNKSCPAVLLAKIEGWIGSSKKGVGILGIGDAIVKALWDNEKVSDPADLYTLTVDDIKDLVMDKGIRVGESRAKKIIANINDKRQLSLSTFLGSLGIELLGRRRVKILAAAAEGQLDNLSDWLDTNKLANLQMPGYGGAVKHALVQGITENRALIDKLIKNGVVVVGLGNTTTATATASVVPAGSSNGGLLFSGLSFCFTGTRECEDEVAKLGGDVRSGISKGLTYLVQKDAMSQSKKTLKAESYGTKIISIDYLKKAIAGEVVLD